MIWLLVPQDTAHMAWKGVVGLLVIASVILDDQEVEALRLPTDPQSVPQLGPTTSPKSADS